TSWVGTVGKWFIAPDPEFQNFYKSIEERNPGALTPDFASLMKGKVTSVATLTPKQKSMTMLADLHPVSGTATHVIAGSRDFFVSPESSEIPYAESSLTVPGGHGSFKSPQAVAEILRILRLPPVAESRRE
ncbi:MAG: alpha/beta hydrolase, partial [Akkermansiaceae bacterium]|nr:alpha/beta hydrolase [Akkermansiaceae bacterium]